jgi:hypothetical protein
MDMTMNLIYNSEHFYVMEYPVEHGYELVDKRANRGAFFQGDAGEKFVQSMRTAIEEDASLEHVDEFLGCFDFLQPVVVH